MKILLSLFITFCIFGAESNASSKDLLDLSLTELLEVKIVTASKSDDKQMNAPLSSAIITNEEIISTGATSWGEILRLLPGVFVRENSAGNSDVFIRGLGNLPPNSQMPILANSLSLVMIDSRIVYNYFAGGTFWETLPISISDIDRIEVVRGAASPLYGPNAVTGVIHIITKSSNIGGTNSHTNPNRFYADFEFGENQFLRSSLWSQFKKGNWNFSASANYSKRDRDVTQYYSLVENQLVDSASDLIEFDTQLPSPLNQVRFPDESLAQEIKGINLTGQYRLSDEYNFKIATGLQNSIAQNAYFENGTTPLNTFDSDSQYLDLSGEMGSVQFQISYLEGEQIGLGVMGWQWDFDTLDANLIYNFQLNHKLKIRPELSFRRAAYDGEFTNGQKSLETLAGSISLDYSPNKSWRTILGIRADNYKIPDQTQTSYQVSFNYAPSKDAHWRASLVNSHRAPFILDVFQETSFTTSTGLLFELFGNQSLEPLETQNIELGVRYRIDENNRFEAEAFSIQNKGYSDVKLVFVGQDGSYFRTTGVFDNLPLESNATGITFSYDHAFSSQTYIRSFMTFVSENLRDHSVSPAGPPAELPQLELVDLDGKYFPSNYGGFTFNHKYEKWNINLNAYIFDKHQVDHVITQAEVKSKLILNSKFTYALSENSNLFINIRNLFDQDSFEYLYTDKTRRRLSIGLHYNL
ncbi:MAG: TonB-dependent receptor [Kangiellaceae bacterium]|nr:TonB-dependent receptor [Kangiellaceae bacterium]